MTTPKRMGISYGEASVQLNLPFLFETKLFLRSALGGCCNLGMLLAKLFCNLVLRVFAFKSSLSHYGLGFVSTCMP